jgi:hypothetical protein
MTVVGNANAIGKSVFKFIVVPVASIRVGMASIRVGIVPMAMVLVSRWWMIITEVGVVAVPRLGIIMLTAISIHDGDVGRRCKGNSNW